MPIDAVQGLAEANSLLDGLPQAAQAEFAGLLAGIASDVLAAERRDVAKRSGALSAGLTIQLLINELRVRVGIIGTKAKSKRAKGENLGDLYYGRFVEFGRRAQTVLAKRRGGREYKLHVSALPARPFVHVERPEIRSDQRLANFWSGVLSRAGRPA